MHNTLEHIQQNPIIPVYYNDDEAECLKVVQACYQGGIRVFEFTDRGKNAKKNFEAILDYRDKNLPELYLGIGTIKTPDGALEYLGTGADFIVSPIVDPNIAEVTLRKGILWIPGCMTPTEIHRAEQAGAKLIKLFPGQLLGPGFLKAVKPLFPDLHFMPTGGVEPTEESLQSWFSQGVYAVGLGSKLFQKPADTNAGDYTWLTQRCRDMLSLVSSQG